MAINEMVDFLLSFKQKDIRQEYRDYLKQVRAMTGPGIVQILNETCRFIDEDKCYLEIGTHRGSTLIGASLNNKAKFYGVDTFEGHNSQIECAPFKTVEEGLVDAISRLTNGNVHYFKDDYVNFFKNHKDVNGQKVEVYLYDGDHQFEHQYKGLKLCTEILADNAIVFVDDSANNDRKAVWDAINQILKEDSRFSVIREFVPRDGEMHGDLWCGFVALEFAK